MAGTAASPVERAASLKALLARNAPQCDELRRLPEENVEALIEAGLFKVMAPRRFGGQEASMRTLLDVSAELGEACGSTAWVFSLINSCLWMSGLFCDETQREVYGSHPDVRICGVLAPAATARSTDGGVRITGRWGYASGCLHSQWAVLGVPPVDSRMQSLALVPMDELRIEDTWHVAGMQGTGSNTLVAQDVFVPDRRLLAVPPAIEGVYATEHTDEVLYRSSFVPALAILLAGPLLGMARGALKLVIERAGDRPIAYTVYARQADSVAFQLQIAEAAMLIDTAALHIARAAEDIDTAAQAGVKLDYLARARVRADTGWAVRSAHKAMDTVISANGASSFAQSSALQRLFRDASTAARHAVVMPAVNQELYGKALLGIPWEQNITPLI